MHAHTTPSYDAIISNSLSFFRGWVKDFLGCMFLSSGLGPRCKSKEVNTQSRKSLAWIPWKLTKYFQKINHIHFDKTCCAWLFSFLLFPSLRFFCKLATFRDSMISRLFCVWGWGLLLVWLKGDTWLYSFS